MNLIVRLPGVGLPVLSSLNLTWITPARMGFTGLLLLTLCLVGFAVAMLRCPDRVVVRCAGSGEQNSCQTELVGLRAVLRPLPSVTGPLRWFWHVLRSVSCIALNLICAVAAIFSDCFGIGNS